MRSSLLELKFGRGIVDLFILDLYGWISLWKPESLLAEVVWLLPVLKLCIALVVVVVCVGDSSLKLVSLCSVQGVEQGGRGCTHTIYIVDF